LCTGRCVEKKVGFVSQKAQTRASMATTQRTRKAKGEGPVQWKAAGIASASDGCRAGDNKIKHLRSTPRNLVLRMMIKVKFRSLVYLGQRERGKDKKSPGDAGTIVHN